VPGPFLEEMIVRSFIVAVVLVVVSSEAAAQESKRVYWGMETADGSTWCGYADEADFLAQNEHFEQAPERADRVTYSSRGDLLEIAEQINDGTGDWVVHDLYTPTKHGVRLERYTASTSGGFNLETTIRGGKAEPFRVIFGPAEAGWMTIPTAASLDDIPFKAIAAEMHEKSIRTICKRGGVTVTAPPPVPVAGSGETYSLRRNDNDHTWCGYTRDVEGPEAAVRASVTYASGSVQEIRLTFAHGADWQVFDRYAPSGSDWLLRRDTRLNLWQPPPRRSLQVVRVTTIHNGKVQPFRVVSAYDKPRPKHGDPTQQPDLSNVNLSPVPVSTNPSEETFMKVVSEMRDKHLDELCRSTQ
jgi:hypothetical protein